MGSLRSLFGYFLSPVGLGVLAALDSSVVFFLPFGVDGALVALVSRAQHTFWIFPIIATIGSLAGAAFTFLIGRTLGAEGLTRIVDKTRLKRIERKMKTRLALTTALLALIPPPFPLTPVILAVGALQASMGEVFAGLAVARLVRFGTEAWVAHRFGPRIIRLLESEFIEVAVTAFIVLALAGTVYSAVTFGRAVRTRSESS